MRRKNTLPDQELGSITAAAHDQSKGRSHRPTKIIVAAVMVLASSAYVVHLHEQRLVLEKTAQQHDVANDQLREERDRLQADTIRLKVMFKALGARLNRREEVVQDLDQRQQDLEEKNLALLERQTKAQQERTALLDDPSVKQSGMEQLGDEHQSLKQKLAGVMAQIENERLLRNDLVIAFAEREEIYQQQEAMLAKAKRDKIRADFVIGQLRKTLRALEPIGKIEETHLR